MNLTLLVSVGMVVICGDIPAEGDLASGRPVEVTELGSPVSFSGQPAVVHMRALIRETSRSLIDIALEVGYPSPSHFH